MGGHGIENRMRELRLARDGMTQQQLADAVGVTRQTVIAIEGGKYSPTLETALRIAAALDASIERVFWLAPRRGARTR